MSTLLQERWAVEFERGVAVLQRLRIKVTAHLWITGRLSGSEMRLTGGCTSTRSEGGSRHITSWIGGWGGNQDDFIVVD